MTATPSPRKGFWARLGVGIGKFLKSLLTAPDGESYAPGRIMGFIVFFVGQAIAIYIVGKVGAHIPPSAVTDWITLLNGLSIWEAAICSLATGLVLGMAPTDSGGKWWSKDASPPPPPTTEPATKLP